MQPSGAIVSNRHTLGSRAIPVKAAAVARCGGAYEHGGKGQTHGREQALCGRSNLDELEIENESRAAWNFAAGATLAVTERRWKHQFPAVARTHQLERLGPSLDHARRLEGGGTASLARGIELVARDKLSGVVADARLAGSRLGPVDRAACNHLVLETRRQHRHACLRRVAREIFLVGGTGGHRRHERGEGENASSSRRFRHFVMIDTWTRQVGRRQVSMMDMIALTGLDRCLPQLAARATANAVARQRRKQARHFRVVCENEDAGCWLSRCDEATVLATLSL